MRHRGASWSRRIALAFLAVALASVLPSPAAASSLTVQTTTVHTGAWAARVDVSRACGASDRTVPDGTAYAATTTEEACVSLSAGDVDVLAGADVTFQSGERIALGSGFSVASGASFRAVVAPQVAGAAFVESRQATAEPEVWLRFYLDPTDLALATGQRFLQLTAADAAGDPELAVGVRHDGASGETRLFVQAVEDGGAVASNEGAGDLVLPVGWHRCELRWRASSGAGDGLAEVCVDDTPGGGANCAALTGLNNAAGRIETLRWGALEVPQGNLGTLYLDDFRAQTTGPIGACDSLTCP